MSKKSTENKVIGAEDPERAYNKEKVQDIEKPVDDFTSQLETYFKKWITVKNEVTEILRKTDSILLAEKKKAVSTSSIQVSPSGAEYIRFNSAVELKPAFLECYCTMLTVNQFIDQKFHYISLGFKNNPPKTGCYIHLQNLINL